MRALPQIFLFGFFLVAPLSALAQDPAGFLWIGTAAGLVRYDGYSFRPLSSLSAPGQAVRIAADPAAWGDVVLWRSDAPSSYHLSVTLDDAAEGVTHVVRGLDLFQATSVHRLLQDLLGLPQPTYHHHRLIPGPDGRKLSKSLGDTALSALRAEGKTPSDIRAMVGI